MQSATAICRSVTLRASSIEGKRDSIPSGASPPMPLYHSKNSPVSSVFLSFASTCVPRVSIITGASYCRQARQAHCSSFNFEYIKKDLSLQAFFKYYKINKILIKRINNFESEKAQEANEISSKMLTISSDIIRESFFNQLPPSSSPELFHLVLLRARRKG